MRSRRSYGAPVAAMGHRLYNFTSGSLPPGATLTRASTGWYFDSAGVLQSAADNVARFTHSPSTLALEGLLVEPARTNSLRNSTCAGAGAGTPGTAPTYWDVATTANSVTRTVVGSGTEDGIPYVDIQVSGTPSASTSWVCVTDQRTVIAAASGQTWTGSAYVRLVAGSLANAGVFNRVTGRTGGGSTAESTSTAITPTSAALRTQRFSTTRTLANGSSVWATQSVEVSYTSGSPIDLTLRIGLPQLALGSGASSPIKTSSAAVARAADVLSLALTDGTYDIDITRLSGVTNVTGAVVSGGAYTVPTDLSPLQSVVARLVA